MKKSTRSLLFTTSGTIKQLAVFVFIVFIASCQKEMKPGSVADFFQNGKTKPKPGQADIVVSEGSSIQAAVNNAPAGSVILIKPGIYKESIHVDKANITIKGTNEKGVVIVNPGDEENGIEVGENGDGFKLYDITVKNFEENGVLLTGVDNFVLSHITAIDCGEYGLFPVFCNGGLIEHCTATGHTDTGIYVGQSENVEMNFNEAYGNVNGFEIENSSHVAANNNQSHDNVAGILVDLLPNLRVTTSTDIELSQNHVYKNNLANFAVPGEGFESLVPSGSGILIVGTDDTRVIKNHIHDNNFVGIAVVSTTVLGAIGGIPPEAFASIEPNPDNARIQKNIVKHNGSSPPPLPLPGVDLLWDGSGTGNCWSGNNYDTSFPLQLPACAE